jgi:hypothetical protein
MNLSFLTRVLYEQKVGPLSQWHGVISGCEMRRPSDLESSCEHVEQSVMDFRQEVVLQLGSWMAC